MCVRHRLDKNSCHSTLHIIVETDNCMLQCMPFFTEPFKIEADDAVVKNYYLVFKKA